MGDNKSGAPTEPDDFDVVEEFGDAPEKQLKKLRAKLKACEEEKTNNLNGWQRAQADVINLKKEQNSLAVAARERGIRDALQGLAPVLDSFHMAQQGKSWETMPPEWKMGMEGIYNQLLNSLSDLGLSLLDPVGQEFDPEEHDSVTLESTNDPALDHHVLKTIQKGLKHQELVIRPAKVVVGKYEK